MSDIEKLHKDMSEMSLGDLLILAGTAVNMKLDKKRLDIIFHYVERGLMKRKLKDLPTAEEYFSKVGKE